MNIDYQDNTHLYNSQDGPGVSFTYGYKQRYDRPITELVVKKLILLKLEKGKYVPEFNDLEYKVSYIIVFIHDVFKIS